MSPSVAITTSHMGRSHGAAGYLAEFLSFFGDSPPEDASGWRRFPADRPGRAGDRPDRRAVFARVIQGIFCCGRLLPRGGGAIGALAVLGAEDGLAYSHRLGRDLHQLIINNPF